MGEFWPSLLIDDPSQIHAIFLQSFNHALTFELDHSRGADHYHRLRLGFSIVSLMIVEVHR
jgi:hypothetical protein